MFTMIEKLLPIAYVVFPDGFEVRASTLSQVLVALGDTDGFFTCISIGSDSLAKKLEELGAASSTVRGSYYKGPKYDAIIKELEKDFPDTTWR